MKHKNKCKLNDKLDNDNTLEQLKRDFTVIRLNEELGLNSYGTEEPRRVYGALIEDLRKYMQGCHALRIYYTVGQCTFSYQYAEDPVAAAFMDTMAKENMPPMCSRVLETDERPKRKGGKI